MLLLGLQAEQVLAELDSSTAICLIGYVKFN